MASVKISALLAGTALAGIEAIPAVQGGATVRITPDQIKVYLLGAAVAPGTNYSILVGTDVPTVADAIAMVSSWVIPPSSSVTISVPAGVTALTVPLTFNMLCGDRVRFEGAPCFTTNVTAAGSVTGSSGNYSVPLNVDDATHVAVGDWVMLRTSAGAGAHQIFQGLCKVTAVLGLTVTVRNFAKLAAWPATTPATTLTSAVMTITKTTITFNACDGLRIDGSLGYVGKMVLVGTRTDGTIGVIGQRMSQGMKNKAYCYGDPETFGVASFGDGGMYWQYGGTGDMRGVCVTDNKVYSILAQHGGACMCNAAITSGCDADGFAGSQSGAISGETSISVGHGRHGYYTQGNGSITIVQAFAVANAQDGAHSAWGGAMRGQNFSARYNLGNGISADGGLFITPTSVYFRNGNFGAYAYNGGRIISDASQGDANGGNRLYMADLSGFISALINTATGQTVEAARLGQINLTGTTGSPTEVLSAGGSIITPAGTYTGPT